MAKKVSHGGRREGAGRKHKHGEASRVKSVKVPESLLEWAESQDGSFSEVVIDALQEARRKSERRKK